MHWPFLGELTMMAAGSIKESNDPFTPILIQKRGEGSGRGHPETISAPGKATLENTAYHEIKEPSASEVGVRFREVVWEPQCWGGWMEAGWAAAGKGCGPTTGSAGPLGLLGVSVSPSPSHWVQAALGALRGVLWEAPPTGCCQQRGKSSGPQSASWQGRGGPATWVQVLTQFLEAASPEDPRHRGGQAEDHPHGC